MNPSGSQAAGRLPRQDNRRGRLLDSAAKLFSERGFHATSMRDIAKAVGMLSGSIYYHFESKEEMMLAVYIVGAQRLSDAVEAAVTHESEPWRRLEAACAAHMRTLLTYRDYTNAMIRTAPSETPSVAPRIREVRRDYEARFRRLIDELALPPDIDRHYLRLLLFGALNWSPVWFNADGDPPEVVAQRFVDTLRRQLDTTQPPTK